MFIHVIVLISCSNKLLLQLINRFYPLQILLKKDRASFHRKETSVRSIPTVLYVSKNAFLLNRIPKSIRIEQFSFIRNCTLLVLCVCVFVFLKYNQSKSRIALRIHSFPLMVKNRGCSVERVHMTMNAHEFERDSI